MAHLFKITVRDNTTAYEVALSGVLDDNEWDLLQRFEAAVDSLLETKLLREGMPSALSIKFSQDTGFSFSTELPPWDDVIVLLHKFRPLLLRKEPTHFNRICNILERRLENIKLRQALEAWRDMFSGKQLQTMFMISSNDEILNSEEVLQAWLNAYEFHRDQEQKKYVDDLHAGFPLDASKVLFIAMLQNKAKAVAGLAAVVRVLMGKQTDINIT